MTKVITHIAFPLGKFLLSFSVQQSTKDLNTSRDVNKSLESQDMLSICDKSVARF